MEQFRNIGIIGRLGSTQVLDTIRRLKRFLLDRHLHVILEDTIAEVLPGHGLQTSSRKILGEVCDLVIVVGGDGSMLGAARALARHKVPVLGINRGSLGFLTDIRPDELEVKVAEVLDGHSVATPIGELRSLTPLSQSHAFNGQVFLRPQQLALSADDAGVGTITERRFLGAFCHYWVKVEAASHAHYVEVRSQIMQFNVGQRVGLNTEPHSLVLFES